MKNSKNRKAFTLIELLVVIAIIAILSVVVILTLNPAELLRQSRDSNRISDLATLKSAVSLYLADVSTPVLGTSTWCDTSAPLVTASFYTPTTTPSMGYPAAATLYTNCNSYMVTATSNVAIATAGTVSRGVTGWLSGWIPVNFSIISSGAPIGNEPVDPVNSSGTASCSNTSISSCGLFYSYVASGTTFKLSAFMESGKYSKGGSADVETNDGGINSYVYEQGTNLSL